MNLPRLYVGDKFKRIVQPISVGITLNTVPLSTASITLPAGEELPARSYVEMFTPYGSAGMFRVRSPHDAYGQETTTAELEHMISEVGDYVVKEELSQMMAANKAMQRVFKHYGGSKWKLGSVSALGSDLIAVDAKYNRVLDAMLSILQQKPDCMMAFDFTTSPWTVKIVKKGTSVTAEGRLERNVTTATISSDDTELCTRVWYQTFDKDKKATWKYRDADTKSTYGIIEGSVSTSSDMTTEEINAIVDTYLNEHKKPRTTVKIKGIELYRITSTNLDKMECGKLFRLALPDYGITVEDNITSVSWSDVYGNPDDMDVSIGSEEDTVVTFLHNLDAKGSGGGGGGRKKKLDDAESKKFRTDVDIDDTKINLMASELGDHKEILNQAGLKLNSKRALIYATEKNTNIMSKINVQKGRIDLVVEGEGKKAKIKRASIVLAVNNGKSSVKISADQVDLGKYATVENLNAKVANIDKFFTGDATAKKIVAGRINVLTLQVNGVGTVWRYFDLDGTRHWYLGMS